MVKKMKNTGHFTSKASALLKLPMLLMILSLLLSGCLYKQTGDVKGSPVSKEAIRNVQGAVDQYLEEKQILPIQNSQVDVNKYEKFRIDFQRLTREGYLENIPGSAFENGGNYFYLIQNEEVKPVVKVQNVLLTQKVIEVQSWVDSYIQANGDIPGDVQIYDEFYSIDFKRLNKQQPELLSLYGPHTLDLMVSTNGVVYVDYAIDIMRVIQEMDPSTISEDQDIRELLIQNSEYVPVKSTAYHFIDGQPVPSIIGK